MDKEKAEHGTGPLEEPYRLDRVNLSEETVSQGLKKMMVDKYHHWDFNESQVNKFGIYLHLENKEALLTSISWAMV